MMIDDVCECEHGLAEHSERSWKCLVGGCTCDEFVTPLGIFSFSTPASRDSDDH